jgi:hypothetical protein
VVPRLELGEAGKIETKGVFGPVLSTTEKAFFIERRFITISYDRIKRIGSAYATGALQVGRDARACGGLA